jgi:hypothetical protein
MSNPKDKAIELFKSFGVTIAERVDSDGFVCDTEQAKKCALIAVNEIIEAIDWHEFETPNKQINYWLDVRKEISNL